MRSENTIQVDFSSGILTGTSIVEAICNIASLKGFTAHRVAHIGRRVLSFLACWPSDAGHDYQTLAHHGFSARLRCIEGQPKLVLPEL